MAIKLLDHLKDVVTHITSAERTSWNSKAAGTHDHTSITGSAAKLTNAITLSIGNKGMAFDGSANRSFSLAEIGAAQVRTGSYVGTGEHGNGTDTTISFSADFVPKLVIITTQAHQRWLLVGRGWEWGIHLSDPTKLIFVGWGANSIKWSDHSGTDQAGTADYQMNETGTTYDYIAIG